MSAVKVTWHATSSAIEGGCIEAAYAPGRGAQHAQALLAGYHGILQCNGYVAYKGLAAWN